MPAEFETNVKACTPLNHHYRTGMRALRRPDRRRVSVTRPTQLTGSVDVDKALAHTLPNDPRWDYGIGCRPGRNGPEMVHWVEVHPATDGEAKVIEAKLDWLTGWLKNNAPALGAMPRRYVWVSSGKTALTPVAPARRRLAQKGLIVAGGSYRID